MYAVVKIGGKQYRVEQGDSLLVDRMPDDEGAKVTLEPLMFRGDGKDEAVFSGDDLAKVKVEATVAGHERGKKIHVLKFKPKKGYKRRQGHRSDLTRLDIGEIKLLSRRPAGAGKAEAKPADAEKAEAKPADAEKAEAKKPADAEKPEAKKPAAKKPAAKKPAAKKEDSDGS